VQCTFVGSYNPNIRPTSVMSSSDIRPVSGYDSF
jgi:hypothetical protein